MSLQEIYDQLKGLQLVTSEAEFSRKFCIRAQNYMADQKYRDRPANKLVLVNIARQIGKHIHTLGKSSHLNIKYLFNVQNELIEMQKKIYHIALTTDSSL